MTDALAQSCSEMKMWPEKGPQMQPACGGQPSAFWALNLETSAVLRRSKARHGPHKMRASVGVRSARSAKCAGRSRREGKGYSSRELRAPGAQRGGGSFQVQLLPSEWL